MAKTLFYAAKVVLGNKGSPFYHARNVQRHPCTALNDTALTGTAPTATARGSWLHNYVVATLWHVRVKC